MRPISLPAQSVGVVIMEKMELVVSAPAAQRERGKPVAQHKNVRVKNVNRGQVVGIALLVNPERIVREKGLFTAVLVGMVIRDGRTYMEQQALRKPVNDVDWGKNLIFLITMSGVKNVARDVMQNQDQKVFVSPVRPDM